MFFNVLLYYKINITLRRYNIITEIQREINRIVLSVFPMQRIF